MLIGWKLPVMGLTATNFVPSSCAINKKLITLIRWISGQNRAALLPLTSMFPGNTLQLWKFTWGKWGELAAYTIRKVMPMTRQSWCHFKQGTGCAACYSNVISVIFFAESTMKCSSKIFKKPLTIRCRLDQLKCLWLVLIIMSTTRSTRWDDLICFH